MPDTSKLRHASDLLADNSGSWKNNRMRRNEEGKLEKVPRGITTPYDNIVDTLFRTHCIHKDANDFRRIVSFVTGMIFPDFFFYIYINTTNCICEFFLYFAE